MSEYDRPIMASNRSYIKNLQMVFQSQALKDQYETKIANQGDLLKEVWLSKYYGPNADALADNGKYIRIK